MRIKRSIQYLESLENIMDFIAKDSVNRAISFYTQLDTKILSLIGRNTGSSWLGKGGEFTSGRTKH